MNATDSWKAGIESSVRVVDVVVVVVVDYALASGTTAYLRLNLESMLSR